MPTHYDHKRLMDEIMEIKQKLGNELLILAHHYQRKEIMDLGDHRGDSFSLAQRAARDDNARYIVFCGVRFMAECAAILAHGGQSVQIPDPGAGCWMADMAQGETVTAQWKCLEALLGPDAVTPVAYVNSHADVKALCGRHGGMVCTSSNAARVLDWALTQGERVAFFPDEHLGRNAAREVGLSDSDICLWDPEQPLGGNGEDDIKAAKLFLWKGHCQVHSRFTPGQIVGMRHHFPGARVVVHPECRADVVTAADASGSTSFIARYVADAPLGSTLILGTEIHLIKRLALEHPDKKILPLEDAFCPNMYKINLKNLLFTLENIGEANRVTIPDAIRGDARRALEGMLSL